MSHDLRTPLNAVSLYTSLAQLKLEQQDQAGQREAFEAICTNATTIARMLDTLLDYASLNSASKPPQMAAFTLGSLCSVIVERSILMAEAKGLSLKCPFPENLIVRTDRAMLERILDNLISNALEYTDRGSIRLEADVARRDLELHVIDTGCGIQPEAQNHIFDEFTQLNKRRAQRQQGLWFGPVDHSTACGALGRTDNDGKRSRQREPFFDPSAQRGCAINR